MTHWKLVWNTSFSYGFARLVIKLQSENFQGLLLCLTLFYCRYSLCFHFSCFSSLLFPLNIFCLYPRRRGGRLRWNLWETELVFAWEENNKKKKTQCPGNNFQKIIFFCSISFQRRKEVRTFLLLQNKAKEKNAYNHFFLSLSFDFIFYWWLFEKKIRKKANKRFNVIFIWELLPSFEFF